MLYSLTGVRPGLVGDKNGCISKMNDMCKNVVDALQGYSSDVPTDVMA